MDKEEQNVSLSYKNHISIDAHYDFIHRCAITDAGVDDSQALRALLDERNLGDEARADSAIAAGL